MLWYLHQVYCTFRPLWIELVFPAHRGPGWRVGEFGNLVNTSKSLCFLKYAWTIFALCRSYNPFEWDQSQCGALSPWKSQDAWFKRNNESVEYCSMDQFRSSHASYRCFQWWTGVSIYIPPTERCNDGRIISGCYNVFFLLLLFFLSGYVFPSMLVWKWYRPVLQATLKTTTTTKQYIEAGFCCVLIWA